MTTENLGISVKHYRTLFFLLFLVICSHYYYLYFIDFNEGVTNTPHYAQILKGILVFIFYLILFDIQKITFKIDSLAVTTVLVFATLLWKARSLIINDYLFLNFFALAMPFIFLRPALRREVDELFFPTLVTIICAQIVIDIFIYENGNAIWANKAFIGGLGNPSSFGFICNICAAYVISRKKNAACLFAFLILAYGICMSKSMTSIGVLITIHALHFFNQKTRKDLLSSCLLACLTLYIFSHNIEGHLIYKIDSLINSIRFSSFFNSIHMLAPLSDTDMPNVSSSIENRLMMHRQLFEGIFEAPVRVIFFGLPNIFYNAADSQLVTFSGSFGIVLTCAILHQLIFPFFNGKLCGSSFLSNSIGFIFIIFCMTNRILDYYPICYIFLVLSGLLHLAQDNVLLHQGKLSLTRVNSFI